jgi:hypothetical protein
VRVCHVHELSARTVEVLDVPGHYSDGGNLNLSISRNGGKRWVFFFRWQGRPREMGLGSAARVRGFRSGENPARWRGHLDRLLPRRSASSVAITPPWPTTGSPKFMTALRARVSLAAPALGTNGPYKALKTALKAEIDEKGRESLYSDTSRPSPTSTIGS